ncbi:CBS domain-containing protein [Candidatus Woesearchaeota archaeon]|nr:CBS domain-containing protein [Candidatus Woesearchaeota archaeon]
MDIKPLLKEDFLVLKDSATLSEMIGALKQFEKRSILVFRNNKYLGMVEKKHLLRSQMDVSEIKLKNFVHKSPLLNENEDIISTAYLMFQSNMDFLPVEREKKIIGVVQGIDVVRAALELAEAKHFKIADAKLVRLPKVNKDDPVAEAMAIMFHEKVDQVPLFDRGKLYGIITYKDILRKYLNWSPKRDVSAKFNKMASSRSAKPNTPELGSLPLSSFSTNDNLLTLSKTGTLKQAAEIMLRNNITDVIIADNGVVDGVMTVKNMLRVIGSLKIPQNFNIQFIGLNKVDLEPAQKYSIQKIVSNEALKLQRKIHHTQFELVVHLKEYEKDGTQHKYSVSLRVEFPGQIITSTEDDWDVETALRKALENAQNVAEKKFHSVKARERRRED